MTSCHVLLIQNAFETQETSSCAVSGYGLRAVGHIDRLLKSFYQNPQIACPLREGNVPSAKASRSCLLVNPPIATTLYGIVSPRKPMSEQTMRDLIFITLVATTAVATFSGCENEQASAPMNDSQWEEEDAEWERQMEQSQQQLEKSEEQIERADKQYDLWEKQAQRQGILLDRQEEQADRFDKILDKWERQSLPQ